MSRWVSALVTTDRPSSFRRDRAVWTLSCYVLCGVPGENVRAMGSWHSTALYLCYADQMLQITDHCRQLFAMKLPDAVPMCVKSHLDTFSELYGAQKCSLDNFSLLFSACCHGLFTCGQSDIFLVSGFGYNKSGYIYIY